MLQNILLDIYNQASVRKPTVRETYPQAYEIFYKIVISDKASRSVLSRVDVQMIMLKLNLTARKIFYEAAKKGHKDSIEFILGLIQNEAIKNELMHAENFKAFIYASENGQIEIMKYLIELTGCPQTIEVMIHAQGNDAFINASENGQIEVMKYLIELTLGAKTRENMIYDSFVFAFSGAARNGHIEVLKYLVELIAEVEEREELILEASEDAFCYVVQSNDVEMMKYILELSDKKNWSQIAFSESPSALFEEFNVPLSEGLDFKCFDSYKYLFELAIYYNTKETEADDDSQELESDDLNIHDETLDVFFRIIAICGKLELLKLWVEYLDGNQKFIDNIIHQHDDEAFKGAAYNGHIEVVKYLVELTPDAKTREKMILSKGNMNGYFKVIYKTPFVDAARNGHIEVVKYLVELTLEPNIRYKMIHANNDNAFSGAAENGHIDVMKYLIELTKGSGKVRHKMIHANNDKAFSGASMNGHIDVMKYLLELTKDNGRARRKMIHANNDDAFRSAALKGHIDIMKYLVELTGSSEAREKMILSKNTNYFKYNAFAMAASGGHIEILKYLLELTGDPETRKKMIHANNDDAFISASGNGHIDIMKYLVEITGDSKTREKMIHANNDEAFRVCDYEIKNGIKHFYDQVIKYLVELTGDPETREKMIHANNDEVFIKATSNINIDIIKYLVELYGDPETRKKMIHVNNDEAFYLTANHGHIGLMECLVVCDPFYDWPEIIDINDTWRNTRAIKNLKYYKQINIKAIKNISISCKNLFSESNEARFNEKDCISLINLPTEILNIIIRNLAEISEDRDKELKAVIKAFTFENGGYYGGFEGFTYRYEKALIELGVVELEDFTDIF